MEYPECFLKMAAAVWKTVWETEPTFLVQWCQNYMIQSHDQRIYRMRSAQTWPLLKARSFSLAWSWTRLDPKWSVWTGIQCSQFWPLFPPSPSDPSHIVFLGSPIGGIKATEDTVKAKVGWTSSSTWDPRFPVCTPECLCHPKAFVNPEDCPLFSVTLVRPLWWSPEISHWIFLQHPAKRCQLATSIPTHQQRRSGNQERRYAGTVSLLGFSSCWQCSHLTGHTTHSNAPF